MKGGLLLSPGTWVPLESLWRIAARPEPITVEGFNTRRGDRLTEALAAGTVVYGASTGFGALASHTAGDDEEQQLHLIAHLATGTGAALAPEVARAMIFDRLVTLSRGYSAASPALISRLGATLSGWHAPLVPRYGSVGASGDLTPLAHAALAFSDITLWHISEPWQRVTLEPFRFRKRDALAFVNGTGASLAMAAIAWKEIAALFPAALVSMSMMVRSMRLAEAAYDERLHLLRHQPGQIAIAEALRDMLGPPAVTDPADSMASTNRMDPIDSSSGEHRSADRSNQRTHHLPSDTLAHEREIQSAYSFRCIPQIVGPILELLWNTHATLERELNAVTDNPVFLDGGAVIHGGNFHGQPVAHACDQLAIGVASLAQVLDRQIARITDPLLNHRLPPFLSGAPTGPNSGMMGLQVSATALAAELRASAARRYLLESRSTNGANQDVVSMSTLAATALGDSLPRLRELIAMHAIAATQALELSGMHKHASDDQRTLFEMVRTHSAHLERDRPLSGDIVALARVFHDGTLMPGVYPGTTHECGRRLFVPAELPGGV